MVAALSVMAAALLVDALIGDPGWLYRRAPHPVTVMGWAIGTADKRFNRAELTAARRRAAGVLTVLALTAITAAVGLTVHHLLGGLRWGWIIEGILASTLLAQSSLY